LATQRTSAPRHPELAAALLKLDVPVDSVIPSIRSVELIDDDEE
jgi:hypothetical protein